MAKSKLINDSDGDDDPDTRASVRHAMHEIGAVAAASAGGGSCGRVIK